MCFGRKLVLVWALTPERALNAVVVETFDSICHVLVQFHTTFLAVRTLTNTSVMFTFV